MKKANCKMKNEKVGQAEPTSLVVILPFAFFSLLRAEPLANVQRRGARYPVARAPGFLTLAQLAIARAIVSALTGSITPRSVIMARIRRDGVTSNAGL